MLYVTLEDYFMGRREKYPTEMSPEIEANAIRTVDLVNQLLIRAAMAGISLPTHPVNKSLVSSGWRPPTLNATVANAAPKSKHMLGMACDIYDPDGDLDEWLSTAAGLAALADLGLWVEHPSATKSWCHVQTVPPRSGRRVFYP